MAVTLRGAARAAANTPPDAVGGTTKPLTPALLKRWVGGAFVKRDEEGYRVFRFPKRTLIRADDVASLPRPLRLAHQAGSSVFKLDAYGNTVYAVEPSTSLFPAADFFDAKGKKLNGATIDEVSQRLVWLS